MDRDRISKLPDEILLYLLNLLPTKYVVATSALSTRWSNLWTQIPILDFEYHSSSGQNCDTLSFVNFVNNVVVVNTSPNIYEFHLKTDKFDWKYLSRINGWIRIVLPRNVTLLNLNIELQGNFDPYEEESCLRLLPCKSLEFLRVSINSGLHMPISQGCFPNLRIVFIEFYESPMSRELVANLFPNLPLLEELRIKAFLSMFEPELPFNIIAPALKIFSFITISQFPPEDFDVKIVIDAPLLEEICLIEDYIASYSFKTRLPFSKAKVCVGKLMEVDNFMDSDSDAPDNILKTMKLLEVVSNSKSMSLSGGTVLALLTSLLNNLPATNFLTKLELVIPFASALKLLMPLLVNSPSLEVLILIKKEYDNKNDEICSLKQESLLVDSFGIYEFIPPKQIPTCLLLHLKEIEVKGVKKIDEYKVMGYIVENANVLNKLTVHPVRSMDGNIGQ